MTTVAPAFRGSGARVVRARTTSWSRRPHAWLYVVAAAGWVVLAWAEVERRTPRSTSTLSGHSPGSHAHLAPASAADNGSWASALGSMAEHVVMVLAMIAVMTPLIARNVRFAALRSPRRARPGVAVAVTVGWASVWVLAAGALAVAGWLVATALGAVATVVLVSVWAVGWQWSRRKRLGLARCHRLLAPPLSPRAARSASRGYGRAIGRSCVTSCLPFMALMSVTGHTILVAAPLAGLAWLERCRRPHHDPATGLTAAGVAVVGVGTATLAAYGLL